jgi:hypothetical protein
MRRRDAAVRDHDDPLSSLVVGEGEDAFVAPHEREAAALLPDDLAVVVDATSAGRLLLMAAVLVVALALGVRATEGMYNLEGQVLFVGGPCAGLAWLFYRDFVRRRRAFRLDDDGITVDVQPFTGGLPYSTQVPWTEIEDYSVVVDPREASLRVVSVRGFTLTLRDRPPRLSTRELIRRFVEQAERHPRAVPPQPRAEGARLPDVTGEHAPMLGGCLTIVAVAMVGAFAEVLLEPSFAQELMGIALVAAVLMGGGLWFALDDAEIARSDARSTRLIARLRRWLRRVLNIRPT